MEGRLGYDKWRFALLAAYIREPFVLKETLQLFQGYNYFFVRRPFIHSIWSCIYRRRHIVGVDYESIIQRTTLLIEFGIPLLPFQGMEINDPGRSAFLLDLYLRTGGDPNGLDEHGRLGIISILEAVNSRNDPCPCLGKLMSLIRAGADVYHVQSRDDPESARTLTDIAYDLDVEDLWFEALERCGLNVDDVCDESDRRLEEHRRLHGAKRTGVDVSIITDRPYSGLKYRRNGRKIARNDDM